MTKRILLSLGGNALGMYADDLVETAERIARPLAELVRQGYEIVLCHGNGPQVGLIKSGLDRGLPEERRMPLADCGAMSQSYIGLAIADAVENALRTEGLEQGVVTLVSRCLVDLDDPGFQKPTKPIGAFLTQEEGERLRALGKTVIEDSGRGYREVVASPIPRAILEEKAILELVTAGHLVIAGGGGGIPVVQKGGRLVPVEAVIDKDWVSVLLARAVEADVLVILTGVEKVAVGFNTAGQKWLSTLTASQALAYVAAGEFAPGSMLPKIEAALQFVAGGGGRRTLITSLDKLVEGLAGKTGTWIGP